MSYWKQLQILGYNGTNWQGARIDAATRALMTIDYEHHEIHSGSHFFIAGYDTYAADGDIDFQVTTPDSTTWAHMLFEIQATGATVFSIYEGGTIGGGGSAVTAYNSNRNSSGTSVLTIQTGGTVTAEGTLIFAQAFGVSGNPTQTAGGAERSAHEIILKQNTTYRFFIESNSADNIISYQGYWYEHANQAT